MKHLFKLASDAASKFETIQVEVELPYDNLMIGRRLIERCRELGVDYEHRLKNGVYLNKTTLGGWCRFTENELKLLLVNSGDNQNQTYHSSGHDEKNLKSLWE